jgi:cation/acetate symporter
VTARLLFFLFLGVTLAITWWAARRTRTTEHFYAAGRSITAGQNGWALAGDFMSASSFLGMTGLVALSGFDGLIWAIGGLVGWPVVLFLVAEPLRNLGKYTFADVVAYRFRQVPVRVTAACGTLATVALYLIAQMVGAGGLIALLFGIRYELAVSIVGGAMIVYVLFGGMLATTWVQIVKATLLLGTALVLAVLVLAQFGWSPLALFAEAAARQGGAVLAPGRLVASPLEAVSLGLALMLGTAGLPHILMRFYTVPDAPAARRSVFYATGLIGLFYLSIFVLGFGAMVLVGPEAVRGADPGGNMAAPLLAERLGGAGFLGFVGAVAFATILAVVAGLTLSGAAALSHDLWVHVVRKGEAPPGEQLRVARAATLVLGLVAILLGIVFKGQNVAFMVSLAFGIAASGNFPALMLALFWRGTTTAGAVTAILAGTLLTLVLIALSPTIQVDLLHRAAAPFPLRNPTILVLPLATLAGVLVSLARPEPAARERYGSMERQAALGESLRDA